MGHLLWRSRLATVLRRQHGESGTNRQRENRLRGSPFPSLEKIIEGWRQETILGVRRLTSTGSGRAQNIRCTLR